MMRSRLKKDQFKNKQTDLLEKHSGTRKSFVWLCRKKRREWNLEIIVTGALEAGE